MMPFNKNTIIIASAGSRKTTFLVEQALEIVDDRILITTYTNENVDLIKSYIVNKNGFIPKNIEVMSWFSFLFRECVKPYLNKISSLESVETINFEAVPPAKRYIKKESVDQYYFTKTKKIYKDRVSDFVCNCNKTTNGLITKRLEKIYKTIFIDELQDFRGWDFSFLDEVAKSSIKLFTVGDPRQATFTTNNARKGTTIVKWCEAKKKATNFSVVEKNECYRSNKVICEFADKLYPEMSATISKISESTEHDGVFIVCEDDIDAYIEKYNPQILRYNKKSNSLGYNAMNIGVSKGNTYDRTLLIPTKPMKDYLKSADLTKAGVLSKYYVALTRARHSVAIVLKKNEIDKVKFNEVIAWQQQ